MTKSQERLLNLLCDNAATLGKNWLEKNREKYEDDLYKAFTKQVASRRFSISA